MEFNEKQHLQLWWLYVLLGIETIIVCSVLFLNKGGISYEELKETYFLPIFVIILPYVIVYVVTQNSFTLKVNEHNINYHYWPFAKNKSISWDKIEKLYIRKYDAFGEYGGWGMRYRLWFKFRDKAYIFNNENLGLQLQLIEGKKLLFSTSKPEELKLFLINLKNIHHIGAIETDVRER